MQIPTRRSRLSRNVIVLFWSALILVSVAKSAVYAVEVLLPLGEVKFESPALLPPLWHTTIIVMKELALTKVKTFQEKETYTIPPLRYTPRVTTFSLGYEHIEGSIGRLTSDDGERRERPGHDVEYDGYAIITYTKALWERGNLSFGAILPYDYMNLDSFDLHRIGILLFGIYKIRLTKFLSTKYIINNNYIYNQISSNISKVEFNNFNTLGGNISIALEIDTKDVLRGLTVKKSDYSLVRFTGSIAFSYQFNKDDADRKGVEGRNVVTEVKEQNLLMFGVNTGIRVWDRAAFVIYGIWNYDATTYKGSLKDVDSSYFDVMTEFTWSFSDRWKLSGGYKKILGYKHLDADQAFFDVSLTL